jgi:glycosyltransferase involved in cell wall biosynthesis
MIDRVIAFPGRLGIQQRVLPAYRAGFFDALAEACEGGLSVFAGEVHPDESISTTKELNLARYVHSRNHHFLQVQSPYYFLWQVGLVRWLQDWNPDVLVVEANPRYLSTRGAIRWMHRQRKPVLGWGLGAPQIEGGSSQWGRFSADWRSSSRKKYLDQLDAVIAYSHKGANEYREVTFPSKPIFVAPNAVARRPEGQPPPRSPGFDKRPKVLFVGRIQPRKRIDNLLRACAALPEALQPQLWIVGDGPTRNELQILADQIYPSAEFPGKKHGSELKDYYSRADLFVLPGTGGLAVQEAMAYGLPVIVAEGDGTQDDLVRSGNGWLIPSDNEQALRETLEEALTDPMRLHKMGAASFNIVQEEINIEHMVEVFVEAANYLMLPTDSHS